MCPMKINVLRSNILPQRSWVGRVDLDKFGRDLVISKGKFYTPSHPIKTENLIPGFGLRIHNSRMNFTAHIMPALENLKELPDKVAEIVDQIRKAQVKSYDETFAFITGGRKVEPNEADYDVSMGVLDSLYGIMAEEKKVPTTVIAEHINPKGTINMHANSKEVTIYDNNADGLLRKIQTTTDPSQDEVADILSEHFNFVEISPDVPVNIVDSMPVIASK